jgi:hypothetical protein
MTAEQTLAHGLKHPYDDREATDAAHRAALGVLADLTGRGGVGDELDSVDDDTRSEIVDSLAEIIRAAGLKNA